MRTACYSTAVPFYYELFLCHKRLLRNGRTSRTSRRYSVTALLITFCSSLAFFVSLSLQTCDDTSPAHPFEQLPRPNTAARSNADLNPLRHPFSYYHAYSVANSSRNTAYFFCSLRNILEKATSTSHAEESIAVPRDLCFDVNLFKRKVKTPGDCRCIVSMLIVSY